MENKMQPATLNFKYGYVNAFTLFSQNGIASSNAIDLQGVKIPYSYITETFTRDNRFLLALAPNTPLDPKTKKKLQENRYLVLQLPKDKAKELKRYVDHYGS